MARMTRFLAVALLGLAACAKSAPTTTENLWDKWGVPHIYAPTDAQAFKAFGYAQMEAHGNLILKLYAEARGRASEYWGEPNLKTDRFVRTMGIPVRAAQWYQAINPAYRANLDAFAAGINQYAAEHADRIADSMKVVLPVSAQDVLAHGEKIINFLFMLSGQVDVPETMNNNVRPGSNMWAISARRSASGNPLLLGNPHLGWYDLYLFFEAEQVTPDRNFYGVALVGFPTLAIGFNDYVGWSHTVNTQDGAEKPFATRTEVIKVKTPAGERSDTLVVKESVQGPVYHEDAKTALALRVAGLDDPNGSEQWWQMAGAKSMAEFEGIVKQDHVPFFNIIAASQDGHIYYFFGGKTPKRSRGDFDYWTGPVRGDSSALIWNDMLPYEQLPHLMDPPTGWLQNANDPPWTVSWPLVFSPDSFPAYVSPREMGFRPQRSAALQLSDSSVTLEELVQYKHSTHMGLADRVLADLLAAARSRGDADARRAADVLDKWDRNTDAESRGAVLFEAWVQQWFTMAKGHPFARAWRLDSALTTPAGLADPALAAMALSAAAKGVEKAYRALDVPYGDVNRLRYGGKDLPGNGGPGDPFGIFRVAYYAPDRDGKNKVVGGDTYYQAVEFGRPVRAKVLIAYGNATQPGSPHIGDQLELFSKKQMRDAWRTRKDVEANLESREVVK